MEKAGLRYNILMNDTNNTAPTHTRADVLAAAQRFAETAQQVARDHLQRSGYTFGTPVVVLDKPGPKFVRVVTGTLHNGQTEPSNRSVLAFVDLSTGDVLKPDGWKRPAKGPRGNVFSQDGRSSLTPQGHVWYAR